MNKLYINTGTGEIKIDDVEIECVSAIKLDMKNDFTSTASITFDCEPECEVTLLVDGCLDWQMPIKTVQSNQINIGLGERIRSLVSRLSGK